MPGEIQLAIHMKRIKGSLLLSLTICKSFFPWEACPSGKRLTIVIGYWASPCTEIYLNYKVSEIQFQKHFEAHCYVRQSFLTTLNHFWNKEELK